MNEMSWRSEDQFDNYTAVPSEYGSSTSVGFDLVQLRKKRDDNPDSYEYRIGKNAALTTGGTENFANIIKPKPPGEWIDLTLKNKELYLYIECVFSISSRDVSFGPTYKISSAKLITAETLPNNFSGTYKVATNDAGFQYYEITLGRALIAMFSKNDLPIHLNPCSTISLTNKATNGFVKPSL